MRKHLPSAQAISAGGDLSFFYQRLFSEVTPEESAAGPSMRLQFSLQQFLSDLESQHLKADEVTQAIQWLGNSRAQAQSRIEFLESELARAQADIKSC